MRAQSIIIDLTNERGDADTLEKRLNSVGFEPNLVFAFYAADVDGQVVRSAVMNAFPQTVLIGGSSAHGVLNQKIVPAHKSIGFLLIDDEQGDYGVGAAEIGDDPAAAAEDALNSALDHSGNQGELPELIWIYQAPGNEEAVLSGLRRVVGDRCPIVGGSAADNDVTGQWSQISSSHMFRNGIVVCAMFPSSGIGVAFQGGYEPNGQTGRVTRLDGGRITRIDGSARSRAIVEIDNKPAAEVYNGWTNGAIAESLEKGGNVLAATNMRPLSVLAGEANGVEQYLLVHPETVRSDGALTTFAEVEEGCEIYCMRGEPDQLILRAGRVARQAYKQVQPEAVAAALVVFCGGCRMALEDKMQALSESLNEQLGDTPLITCFTFGEQGPILGQNNHGNLMISAIVMGD